jgi:hypothetical protein
MPAPVTGLGGEVMIHRPLIKLSIHLYKKYLTSIGEGILYGRIKYFDQLDQTKNSIPLKFKKRGGHGHSVS